MRLSAAFWRGLDERIAARVRRLGAPLRGVATRVVGSGQALLIQLSGRADESLSDVEVFQHYGFASVPAVGVEVVAVAVGHSTAHLIVVGEADRGVRPTDLEAGEVALYSQAGARIVLKADGSVEVAPAEGQRLVLAGGGAAVARLGDEVALPPDVITSLATQMVGGGLVLAGTGTVVTPIVGATAAISSGSALVESG